MRHCWLSRDDRRRDSLPLSFSSWNPLIDRSPTGPDWRTIAHQKAYFSATWGGSLSSAFAASRASTIVHILSKVYYLEAMSRRAALGRDAILGGSWSTHHAGQGAILQAPRPDGRGPPGRSDRGVAHSGPNDALAYAEIGASSSGTSRALAFCVRRESFRASTIVPGWVLAAAWWLLGCGGAVDGSASTDASSKQPAATASFEAGVSACDHYFTAQYSRCGGPILPTSETTRILARFEQVCQNQIALPGSGMTPTTVEACAAALDASSCELPYGPPAVCNFHGSLPGGAPCNEGLQCQSGLCGGTALFGAGGQLGPWTCGTCEPFAAIGKACSPGGCSADAICLAKGKTSVCVAITQGDVGATCDALAAQCKTGLYCSAQTGRCAKPAGAGEPCGEGSDPGGCAAPLGCAGTPETCRSGSVGAQCISDPDCASGLGCGPSGTCNPVSWVAAGQVCDGYNTRCLVGVCQNCGPMAENCEIYSLGTCPTVAPDGQPCGLTPSTCDTVAECFSPTGPAGESGAAGICTLLDSNVCR
jgi:hypothetical protein